MIWSCGLLEEQPNRTLSIIRRGYWHEGLPPELDRELRIWMSMPGFSVSFHHHTLGVGHASITRWIGRDYEQFKREVGENWLSATRDDCVKLARMRPSMGDMPLLCKLQIMDDLKRGGRPFLLADEYATNSTLINELRNGHVKLRQQLPDGFELLIPV